MMTLDNFSAHEITNTEEVKGGTFGCFSLFSFTSSLLSSCLTPCVTTTSCYTPPVSSCNTGGYSSNCAPAPAPCAPTYSSCTPSYSSWSWGSRSYRRGC